ncbi:hypothetical protein AB751O23_AX_00030 [Chlamydiales bacterium SCGC AB-751-O23]|nr:hypothetical protein AB751O23_AX_00030 [Chlamydiales bacterium SCGC AB-751-O23]
MSIDILEEKLKVPWSIFSVLSDPMRPVDTIVVPEGLDLELEGKLYERADDLPILKQAEDSSLRPQQWGASWYLSLLEAAKGEVLKDFYYTRVKPNASIEEMLGAYGANSSILLSPESTIQLIFNGIYPCNPLKTDQEGVFKVEINWDGYEKKDDPVIPNASLLYSMVDCKPVISEITLQYEGEEERVFKPENPDFLKALYHFNCSAFYKGEISKYLGKHISSEQYALAVFRCLNNHPIGTLLKPCLREVVEIDNRGKKDIFGDQGILARGPLKTSSIKDHLRDDLRGIDYSNFSPREVLFEGHNHAKCGQKFWEILETALDKFFTENKINHEDPETKRMWYQIYHLSETLVGNSVEHREEDDKNYNSFLDTNEIDNPGHPGRRVVDGQLKTVRPITNSIDNPTEEDIQRLKQFCMHAIYEVTFGHWWVHASQKTWGLEMGLASLAPKKFGDLPYGGTEHAPAQHQISISKTLSDFDRGGLIANMNGDVYQGLIEGLRGEADFFSQHGLDIHKVPYGTII